jgi:poly-gamma-glutamate synthesis protein (capsule biosynthesis protein)
MAAILLTGDVMLGRGIDQILEASVSPELSESFVKSALTYVSLAEQKNGRIPRRVPNDYVWGDALKMMRDAELCIVNLETAMTRAERPAPKGINYRCHPANVSVLTAGGVDCCVLSNNHVMDWNEEGLLETLTTVESAGIKQAGAGRDCDEAAAPAVLPLPAGGRVLVYGLGSSTSGIPLSWAAKAGRPGVNYLGDHGQAFKRLRRRIEGDRQPGDIVIVSIHWGPNWGYDVDQGDRRFAHCLIDEAGVDVIHGHSSHHPKPLEMRNGRLILYGCGDFLNDYEGISGHEAYRGDLVAAYALDLAADGSLRSMALIPFQTVRFQLKLADAQDADWMVATLDRECRPYGTRVSLEHRVLRVSPTLQKAREKHSGTFGLTRFGRDAPRPWPPRR